MVSSPVSGPSMVGFGCVVYGPGMVVLYMVQVWLWYGCVVSSPGMVVVWLCDTWSR